MSLSAPRSHNRILIRKAFEHTEYPDEEGGNLKRRLKPFVGRDLGSVWTVGEIPCEINYEEAVDVQGNQIMTGARQGSAEHFSRLNARCCTAMAWIFIPVYCFAVP